MKQILPLALALIPCLAWAQYPSNGNQKITLGEQTTADGLIYRGVLVDTGIITPSSDTSAYIILDTVNHRFYNYNRATNVWSVAGGGTAVTTFSGGSTGLTPNTATSGAVTLGGTLAVANGGTGSTTQNFVDLTNTQTVGGAKTFTSAVTATRFNPTSSSATGTGMYLPSGNTLGFSTDGTNRLTIASTGAATFSNSAGISNGNGLNLRAGGNSASDANVLNFTSLAGTINVSMFTDAANSNTRLKSLGNLSLHTGNIGISADNERITILSTGDVGIGTTSPTEKLHVAGNARITAMNGINDIGADANGVLQAATSDMNLKNTIENSPFGLKEILLLNPVTFLYNDTNRKIDSDVKEVGFIAQDVFDIIPNAVSSTGTSDLQLDYRAITATLVKAIQEQQALIKALEQRIINLENK